MKSTGARDRLANSGKFSLPAILTTICTLAFGMSFFAWVSSGSSASEARSITVPLQFKERGGSLFTRINLGKQEVKFRREPDFEKNDRIVRRALRVGSGEQDFLGLAINATSGNLYLDLNQNLDLTDDPKGVFRSARTTAVSAIPVAFFRDIRLALGDDQTPRRYLLDLICLGDDATINIRSSYEAGIELEGQKWRFQVQDNLDGRFDAGDLWLLAPSDRNADARAIQFRQMPVTKKLVLRGHQYLVDFEYGAVAADPPLTARFTAHNAPTGELALNPQYIAGMILQGTTSLLMLDPPESPISVPADAYRVQQLYLQSTPGKLCLLGSSDAAVATVRPGVLSQLRLGPPLVSTVAVIQNRNMLLLQYVLKGAAGEQYTFLNTRNARAPRFAIYRGDQEIASGSFRFG